MTHMTKLCLHTLNTDLVFSGMQFLHGETEDTLPRRLCLNDAGLLKGSGDATASAYHHLLSQDRKGFPPVMLIFC